MKLMTHFAVCRPEAKKNKHHVLTGSLLMKRVMSVPGAAPIIIIIIINPFTARVVGAPQMISQPISSIFPCSPLPSGTCRTPGLSIPRRLSPHLFVCLPCLLPLSPCLARWFWSDRINGRHVHTTSVCVSSRWSGLRVVRLLAGSWHILPSW